MTPERFRQIRNLFDAALERDAALRTSFLAEACQGDEPLRAEVGRLVSAHQQQAALLDREPIRPELLIGEPGRMEGRRIDHYEILRELGRGGMGAVYLAVRTDDVYRKPVALKVVRSEAGTPEVIHRFRREREILASLDHPNLARLLDGGTTPEGLPYFVMDYAEGQPIDAYCDERQLNLAERLKLFRAVCAAVEYAHGRGVVHRDLKPGNILVTAEGAVKLLDFGIARLLGNEGEEATAIVTHTGMRLMTPEYASPEQVRGERVGTASDIYSLGAILYELLTGHRPYRMRSRLVHEVVRVICEEEPTRPSTAVTEVEQRLGAGEDKPVAVTPQSVSRARAVTPDGLRRQLSGDPDKILLKALRKDPAERYRTAEALGEDVRRHLEGMPVLAQGESAVYRAGKFLQRNRGWVIAAGVMLAALASGLVRLNPLCTFVLLFFLTFLPAGYYGLRKRYGHNIASRTVARFAEVWLVYQTAFMVVMQLAGDYLEWFVSLPLAPVVVLLGTSLARWPFRERWAGPLLLDLTSRKERKTAYTWASVLAVFTALMTAWVIHVHHLWRVGLFDTFIELTSLTLIVLVIVRAFVCAGRVELRTRGIMISNIWLPWSNVESCAWQDTEGEFAALNVRSKKWLLFLLAFGWTYEIILPAAQKSPADAILKRQLAEWPGS
jgi:serine/threonine protein kinase/uncharacterized membrane protein YobD (UPF0266 family)